MYVCMLASMTNAIIRQGKSPVDWQKSVTVECYKDKGDALDEKLLRDRVTTNETQLGFMPGKKVLQRSSLLLGNCKRNILENIRSCTSHLWIWRRHLTGYQER